MFNLEIPLKWEGLGVIVTAIAVIVALLANRISSKQLKAALKMQEQTINISLLEKRLELANRIAERYTVPLVALNVLFNPEIVMQYNEVLRLEKEYSALETANEDLFLQDTSNMTSEQCADYNNECKKIKDDLKKSKDEMKNQRKTLNSKIEEYISKSIQLDCKAK